MDVRPIKLCNVPGEPAQRRNAPARTSSTFSGKYRHNDGSFSEPEQWRKDPVENLQQDLVSDLLALGSEARDEIGWVEVG